MVSKHINRNSNIELLRIIAMLGVILLHYNNTTIGGAFNHATLFTANSYILYLLECIFIPVVNLYILISGYYMYTQTEVNILKPIKLIFQVILFKQSSYLIFIMIGKASFSFKEFRLNLLPVNYFVIFYIALYLLSPFINAYLRLLTEKSFTALVLLLVILFSVWPTLVDILSVLLNNNLTGLSTISIHGSQYGYTIVNFILMYIIGAYIRQTKANYKPIKCILLLLLCWGMLFVWSQLCKVYGYSTSIVFSYCNPLVIGSAVIILIIFINMKNRNNRIINLLSKGCFTVFLLHTCFLNINQIQQAASGNPIMLILHIIASCTVIYILCWIISLAYSKLENLIFKPLEKKLSNIVIVCNTKK